MWRTIDEKAPPQYTDLLVVHNSQKRVMRHESNWWYGLKKGDCPAKWFDDPDLIHELKLAREGCPKINYQI